ncbi:MAG: CDP-alcohol phosphatidyltransferase family protein [Bryobacterales bacterium]
MAIVLGGEQAVKWAVGALLVLAYLGWELRRGLDQNVRVGESEILPTLGLGTRLTLLRGLFTAMLAGFVFLPQVAGLLAWAPCALYLGVAVADFFDGYAARVSNHATRLGAALDVAFDALGAITAVSVLVAYGRLPAAFLSVGLVYYIFHGHMKLRRWRGRPVLPLQSNPYRRMYAGFLFGYFAVALAPVFDPVWIEVGGYLFVTPVMVGFLIDWLAVTGALSIESPTWVRFEAAAWTTLYRVTPVVLRAALLVAAAAWLTSGLSPEGWTNLLAELGWPAPTLLATGFALASLTAVGMTAAGWLARLAALVLVAAACLDAVLRGEPTPEGYALLLPSIGLLLLGAGRGVLWRPEDELLLTQAGSRRCAPAHPERAAA